VNRGEAIEAAERSGKNAGKTACGPLGRKRGPWTARYGGEGGGAQGRNSFSYFKKSSRGYYKTPTTVDGAPQKKVQVWGRKKEGFKMTRTAKQKPGSTKRKTIAGAHVAKCTENKPKMRRAKNSRKKSISKGENGKTVEIRGGKGRCAKSVMHT